MVDSWRRYKRDLTEAEDRPGPLERAAAFAGLAARPADPGQPPPPEALRRLSLLRHRALGAVVLLPLLMISIALDHDFGTWKWTVMGSFAAFAGVALYLYSAADEQKYWDSL